MTRLHKFTKWTKDYHNHYDFDKNNLRMTNLFKDPELTQDSLASSNRL